MLKETVAAIGMAAAATSAGLLPEAVAAERAPGYVQVASSHGCHPCGAAACSPCAADPCAADPCAANPCAANPCAANPCNPCAVVPCNPCNPCAAH